MEINNLHDFIRRVMELLKIIDAASPVLFRQEFRNNYHISHSKVCDLLEERAGGDFIKDPESDDEFKDRMVKAGLIGDQLKLKLESFSHSLNEFEQDGGINKLKQVLKKAKTILTSLAGAIPNFGSFAQEFLDFILRELEKRGWLPRINH